MERHTYAVDSERARCKHRWDADGDVETVYAREATHDTDASADSDEARDGLGELVECRPMEVVTVVWKDDDAHVRATAFA
ncbi:MAG: hypothetical protein NVS2B3_09400 [Vulcanimicrobiaceae bacterium]